MIRLNSQKPLLLFCALTAFIFVLSGCGGDDSGSESVDTSSATPTLVATIAPTEPVAEATVAATEEVTETETAGVAATAISTVTEELADAAGVTDTEAITDAEGMTDSAGLVSQDVTVITDTQVITGTEVNTDIVVTTNTVVLTQNLVTTVVTATELVTDVANLTDQSTTTESVVLTDTGELTTQTETEGVAASVEVTGTTPTPTRRPTATPTVVVNLTRVTTDTIVVTDTEAVSVTATPAARATARASATPTRTSSASAGSAITSTETATDTSSTTSMMGVVGAADRTVRASELLDYDVENLNGEDIGDLNDLIIDMSDGRILFATMEYGGVLGFGANTYPLPLQALRSAAGIAGTTSLTGTVGVTGTSDITDAGLGLDDNVIVFNIAEETLENAPGYDADWPDLNASDFEAEFRQFWSDPSLGALTDSLDITGTDEITVTDIVSSSLAKASELIGFNIENADGDNIGEINDLLVDLGSGHVTYAVLSFGGFLGLGDQLVAIPLSRFESAPETNGNRAVANIVLNVEPETLENAPAFDPDAFPETNTAGWDTEWRQYWGQNQ